MDKLTTEQKFNLAVLYVQKSYASEQYKDSQKVLTNDEKLKTYALYKQATVGPCSKFGGERPGLLSFTARAKWDAWNALGDMSKETAQLEYIKNLKELAPEWEQWPAIVEKAKEMLKEVDQKKE